MSSYFKASTFCLRDFTYRRPIFHSHKHANLLFVWLSDIRDLSKVISIFDRTVLICNQRIDPGVYSINSKIIFFIRSKQNLKEYAQIIFGHRRIKQSPYVAVAREERDGTITFFGFDFFETQNYTSKQMILTYVWSKSNPILSLNRIYTDRSDFKGKEIRIGAMPYSHCVVAKPVPIDDKSWSNKTQFQDHYGFEIDILEASSRVLNFTYKLFNHAELGVYFDLMDDNSYTGLLADVWMGEFDVSMGASLGLYIINQVLDNSISFDKESYEMASPIPQVAPRFFAIVDPFSSRVWLLLSLTFVTMVAAFKIISMAEEKILKLNLNRFNSVSHSFQYCLRTILIDSVPQVDITTKSALTLR